MKHGNMVYRTSLFGYPSVMRRRLGTWVEKPKKFSSSCLKHFLNFIFRHCTKAHIYNNTGLAEPLSTIISILTGFITSKQYFYACMARVQFTLLQLTSLRCPLDMDVAYMTLKSKSKNLRKKKKKKNLRNFRKIQEVWKMFQSQSKSWSRLQSSSWLQFQSF